MKVIGDSTARARMFNLRTSVRHQRRAVCWGMMVNGYDTLTFWKRG